jgi:spoIIIJ-associated protein
LRQVEIQAFSVEEAVRLALEQLGRTRDQVSVEVLATDPGSEEVLVRVTARDVQGEVAEEEVSPKGRRAPVEGDGHERSGGRRGDQIAARTPDRDRDRERPRERFDRPPRGERGERGERPVQRSGSRAMAPSEEEVFEDESAGSNIAVDVNLDSSLQTRPLAPGEHATPEDAVAPIAAEILQRILVGMRVRGRIVRREASEEGEAAFPDDQPSLILNITGLSERDQNALIGRRGETLDALQFLLNLIIGRQVDLWTRVIVDVEGHRLRRKFALINLAKRTAEQVQARNQAIPLEAMPPYERRIIHMTLSEHPAVLTESTGMEPDRRVIVLPK